MKIHVKDFPWRFKELVQRAEAGEEVIVLRRGAPAARLVALSAAERRKKAKRLPGPARPRRARRRFGR